MCNGFEINGAAIKAGETQIVLGVLRHIGMLAAATKGGGKAAPVRSDSSHWLRAPIGGLMRAKKELGDRVKSGETIALISDPSGIEEEPLVARSSGVVIGRW